MLLICIYNYSDLFGNDDMLDYNIFDTKASDAKSGEYYL